MKLAKVRAECAHCGDKKAIFVLDLSSVKEKDSFVTCTGNCQSCGAQGDLRLSWELWEKVRLKNKPLV